MCWALAVVVVGLVGRGSKTWVRELGLEMELELVMVLERWELALVGIADRSCLVVVGIVGKSWSCLVMVEALELGLVLAVAADRMVADMDRMVMGRMRLVVAVDLVKADRCLCL